MTVSMLDRLREQAAGASMITLAEAINELHNATKILDIDRAEKVARLARNVAAEADRLAARRRLRDIEREAAA